MNEAWLKALILGCTFGAVLLAVEVLVSWLATNRSAGTRDQSSPEDDRRGAGPRADHVAVASAGERTAGRPSASLFMHRVRNSSGC